MAVLGNKKKKKQHYEMAAEIISPPNRLKFLISNRFSFMISVIEIIKKNHQMNGGNLRKISTISVGAEIRNREGKRILISF